MFENDPLYENEALSYHEQTYVRGKPKAYLLETIRLFNELPVKEKVIVEIGAARRKMGHDIDALCLKEISLLGDSAGKDGEKLSKCCCNDGHATYFWLHYTDAQVYSVDIEPKIQSLYKVDPRLNRAHFHLGDGISFLKKFNRSIDLLFLDAWDVVPDGDYAECHLRAFNAAKDNLNDNALILIDDTDVANGGKGRLLRPVLYEEGYECVFAGRQTLFRKN